MTTIIFKKDYNINLDILDTCTKHIKNSRLGLIIKRLSNSIRADGMLPDRMDEHDSFFIPKNDDEKTLWDNLRASAKIQIKSIITGRINGSKGGRPKEIKQEQPAIEPQKEESVKPIKGSFVPPTEEEILTYAKQMNDTVGMGGFPCSRQMALEFFANYDRQGWMLGNGNHMSDWKNGFKYWALREQKRILEQLEK